MPPRSRLRDLLAQSNIAQRDIEIARAKAARDSANFKNATQALAGLVPGIAGLYGDTVKRDEDKKEKLRLEKREDDALLAKLNHAEKLAQAKAEQANAKAKAELDAKAAKEAEEAENARAATMAGGLAKVAEDVAEDNRSDEARATVMSDALKQVAEDVEDPGFENHMPAGDFLERDKTAAEIEKLRAEAELAKKKAKGGGGGSSKKDADKKAAADAKAAKDNREDADSLRKEFASLPEVKEFKAVDDSFKKMKVAAANPSPAGDLVLVYSFMKMQDPSSTVREGEFAAAAKAGNFGDQMQAAVERITSGQILTPDQRADFVAQAEAAYAARKAARDDATRRYDDIATRRSLNTLDVTGSSPVGDVAQMTPEQRRARIAELRAKAAGGAR